MDQEVDDLQEQEQEEQSRNPLRDHVRSLEQKLEELSKANAELTRTNAFLAAGVNPADDKPMIRYFVRGYDGELTPEAIRDAAIAAGVLSPSGVPSSEREAVDRIDKAASAGAPNLSGPEAEIAAIRATKSVDELREVIRQINAQRS